MCNAETQLMSAVVAVLNESLTESIKGFYRLRKAYVTLDGVLAAEARYLKKRGNVVQDSPGKQSVTSLQSNGSARSMNKVPGGFDGQSLPNSKPSSIRSLRVNGKSNEGNDSSSEVEDEFYDADEGEKTPEKLDTYAGNVEANGVTGQMNGMSVDDTGPETRKLQPSRSNTKYGIIDHDPESDIFSNPIDVFIHSGANLCFGLLLVMISLIPPAFSKLLFIIGFHGDKDRGMRMLWQASKFHNINGAMAGLIVLGFYNTFMGFSDIIPDENLGDIDHDSVEGFPKERCAALLADMRRRHPKSHLWQLEEARMQAGNKNLAAAIKLLEGKEKSPLKQVEAIEMFERSLNAMYIHDYPLCAKSFVACVSLNNWSHALYYYIAGSATVELYRQTKDTDPAAAKVHAEKATELLRMAPKHAGKKKFMARQLPFDLFATRKLHKWEARAQEWNVPLVDAVGVSPIEEMIFLWNGYKRMDASQLQTSMDRLTWSETSNPHWHHESVDERAILALLRGATLRNLGRFNEAEAAHQSVLDVNKADLKGGFRDDWTAPAAHYEMGVICWMRRSDVLKTGDEQGEELLVRECEKWIDKAAKWEAYELDARIGLKVATAQDTLRRWNEKKQKKGKGCK